MLLLLCAGCGARGGHVSGKVLMKDGKPLPGGTITFYSDEGSGNPISGAIHEDGTYDVRGVPLGRVKVTVSNLDLKQGAHAPAGVAAQDKGNKRPNMADMQKNPKGGPPAGIQVGPPKEAMAKMSERPPDTVGAAAEKVGTYVPIDGKFVDPGSSPLTCDVQRGDQTKDFNLN
jgi:hypothetical protein